MEQGKQIGDWKCIRILGRGSFGVVGLFKNLVTSEVSAVKKFEIRSQSQAPPRILSEMQERWKKEVEMMYTMIDSPHIVSTCPVPEELKGSNHLSLTSDLSNRPPIHLPLLCMEFCSAGDLRQMLKKPENISGLNEKAARTVLECVSQAICYLHDKNIIHRDLKPENILAQHDPSSGKTSYKLSDLGFAKDLSNSQSLCSTVVGTMQYLAPEIYMGKRYDKTVDFWSFGVIAFEVICGMRPFLHGESPSQWIPLVEEKGKDVIAIYRTHEDRIEFSKEIPYFTHCSEMLKKCLESWFPTMLQLDPVMRGKKDVSQGSPVPQGTVVGLSRLNKILNTKTLDILTHSKRMSFAIGRNTKISEIQTWISKDIGMAPGCQLIITMDGVEITGEDLACQFIELTDLYLIPRTPSLLRLKSKIPINVNAFLKARGTGQSDPLKLQLIWSHSIYFVQTQIDRLNTMKKASESLKIWFNSTYTSVIKNLVNDVDKSTASLDKILELETQLQEIERRLGDSAVVEESHTCNLKNWLKRKDELRATQVKCLNIFVENVAVTTVRTSDVEEILHNIYKTYEDWRSAASGAHCEILARNLYQFLLQREPLIDSIIKNITIILEKVETDSHIVSDLKGVTVKLNDLINDVIKTRCAKQTELLRAVSKSKLHLHTNGFSGKENSPARAQSNNTNPNTIYATSSKQMSKSAVIVSPSTTNEDEAQKKYPTMAKSCNSGLPGAHATIPGPPLQTVIEDSKKWQKLSDDTLHKTMESLTRILKENAEMDWEFLD